LNENFLFCSFTFFDIFYLFLFMSCLYNVSSFD
jgi:hypothetical protein